MNKKINGLKQIAHKYKNYFFDLDGVFWKGQEAIPGSFQVLNQLRKQNKNLFFITNSSLKDRETLMQQFSKYQFKAYIQECFPSAYISTLYLKQKYPHIKKLLLFGNNLMAKQFITHGFDITHVKQSPAFHKPIDIANQGLDQSVQGVVVGWCSDMTFAKQCLIGFYAQNGIKLFGTNPDKFTIVGKYKVPGAGSIIAAIQTGCETKAQIMGKPNTFIIDKILKQKNLNKQQSIMIGDYCQTDIIFGNKAGISTLLVLTGVTTQQQFNNPQKMKDREIPTYYSNSLYQ